MDIRTWEGDKVKIMVDYDKCNGNGACVEICPTSVYEIQEGKTVPVAIDECIECCACVENCPMEAIVHSSC